MGLAPRSRWADDATARHGRNSLFVQEPAHPLTASRDDDDGRASLSRTPPDHMTTRPPRRVPAAACALALCLTPSIASGAGPKPTGRARSAGCSSQGRGEARGRRAPVCSGATRGTRRAVRTKAHGRHHAHAPQTAATRTRTLGHRRPSGALLASPCQPGDDGGAAEEHLQPGCGEAAGCEAAGASPLAPGGAGVCSDPSGGPLVSEELACEGAGQGAACPVEDGEATELSCEAGDSACT